VAKHRRGRRHREPNHRVGQSDDTRTTASGSHSSASYRPRDQYRPADVTDAVDRHLSRATEADDSLERYLRLLRFGRSTALVAGFSLFGGAAILGSGITVAVAYAGLPLLEALGFGAGGSAAIILTLVFAIRRWFRIGVDMLSRAGQVGWSEAPSAVAQVVDLIAAVEEREREPMQLPPSPGAR
jgi:hypothetical protein